MKSTKKLITLIFLPLLQEIAKEESTGWEPLMRQIVKTVSDGINITEISAWEACQSLIGLLVFLYQTMQIRHLHRRQEVVANTEGGIPMQIRP